MASSTETEALPRTDGRPQWVDALLVFAVVVAAVTFAVWLGARGPVASPETHDLSAYPGSGLFGGWFRYDARWYHAIATDGYFFAGSDSQSSVAFFPAYPTVLWALHAVTGVSVKLLGTLVTLACGAGVVVLFRRWCADRVEPRVAMIATVTLLLYPYAYYLMGALYADALFLVAAIGAFVLLERGHPVLAGLAGAVATAARPVGLAVILGLVAVTLWRRHVIARREGRVRLDLRALRPADAGVLLSVGGLLGWMTYLGVRFGHPFAFEEVQQAPGWDQAGGPRTWFKVTWFQQMRNLPRWAFDWWRTGDDVLFEKTQYAVTVLLQGALVLFFLYLAYRAWRRFGWGYGAYSFALLAIPLLGTKDFMGTGRYLLAAFPCYLALGEMLSGRTVLRRVAWVASGAILLGWAFAFGRGYYVA
jgi:hypothetical protein